MPMTVIMAAIQVQGMAQRLGARPLPAPACQSSISLVRMHAHSCDTCNTCNTCDTRAFFLPAITSHRRPAELKRQQYKQHD